MKKNELLKIIGIFFLVAVVLTWIIPTGSYQADGFSLGNRLPLGIFDLPRVPLITIASIPDYIFLILAIGALYGVINSTGVYSRIVEKIASTNNKRLLLIAITCIFALITSLVGANYGLLVIVPFAAAIVMKAGYSRLIALLSTIGAILIGNIGAIFSYDIAGMLVGYLDIKLSDLIFWRIIIFVGLLSFYIYTILKFNPKNNDKESKNAHEEEVPLYEDINNNKKSSTPLIVVGIVIIIIILISMFSWKGILNVDFFNKMYENINNVAINNFPILKNIIGTIVPFGYWNAVYLTIFIILIAFIIGWLYSLRLDGIIDSMRNGMKVVLPTAFYVGIASVVFAVMFSASQTGDNIFYTIYHAIMPEKFNVFTTTLGTILGGVFYNNFTSFLEATSTPLLAYQSNELLPLMGLITSAIHGLMMMVLPTSVLLIGGLSLYRVSYKEWLKNMWKFLLVTLVGLVIIFTVISLIVV